MNEETDRHLEKLLTGKAAELLGHGIHVEDLLGIRVDKDQGIGGLFEEGLRQLGKVVRIHRQGPSKRDSVLIRASDFRSLRLRKSCSANQDAARTAIGHQQGDEYARHTCAAPTKPRRNSSTVASRSSGSRAKPRASTASTDLGMAESSPAHAR